MARKTVMVCDECGREVEDGKGAVMRVTFNDARRGAKQADLCDSCARQVLWAAGCPPRAEAKGACSVRVTKCPPRPLIFTARSSRYWFAGDDVVSTCNQRR